MFCLTNFTEIGKNVPRLVIANNVQADYPTAMQNSVLT